MADAIISAVVEQVTSITADKIRKEVSLVRGVKKELHSLSLELNTIRNALADAETRRFKEASVNGWLKRLEATSYEMDDVLDEWNYLKLEMELQPTSKSKVHSFIRSSYLRFTTITTRHDTAKKIEILKAKLGQIMAEKVRYDFVINNPQPIIYPSHDFVNTHATIYPRKEWRQSTSLINGEIQGRDFERKNLVSRLVAEDLGTRVLSIVGAGGLGKTTLAKLVYNDSRVESAFELRIWICVSDPFKRIEIANEIITRAGGDKPDSNQLDTIVECLKRTISGRKFLLVLDDVWTENYNEWEDLHNSLRCGGAGSKILVTTRNDKVARIMGSVDKNEIHHLGQLSDENCWSLIRRIALPGMDDEKDCEKFEKIGRDIAKKCKGLPLAAKTLGSLLQFKNTVEEWEKVLNSEIWQLEEAKQDIFPHLLLSYNELSPPLKCCFSYCAVFPKDTKIGVGRIITNWMALGYLGTCVDWELRGREYYNKLAMCSLFQDFDKGFVSYEEMETFKMHDILHDFAQFIRKNGGMEAETEERTCQTCSPWLISHSKQYRSLFFSNNELPPQLCDCLTSVRLLNLRECGLQSIPVEIEKLIHLRWLDLGENEFPDKDLKIICKLYNLQFLWIDRCDLVEIPHEIGNLIRLKQLDLSKNNMITRLPHSLCNLRELETLNISSCWQIPVFPQPINRLINLKHLRNTRTECLTQLGEGVAELTSLRTLSRFRVGEDACNLGWLKNLNRLSGSLELCIGLSGRVVKDAREAELSKKTHIQSLKIEYMDSGAAVVVDILNALEPHPNLQKLEISGYKAAQLPGWITSPVNHLRSIKLRHCTELSFLPPLAKLPFLENIEIYEFDRLKFMGREFLGITERGGGDEEGSSSTIIGFPQLKTLSFKKCRNWKEWEDITAEEEHSELIFLMPCLEELIIDRCDGLTKLPHRLLRKVSSSLKTLVIQQSEQLEQVYFYKSEAWKSISRHNPRLRLT